MVRRCALAAALLLTAVSFSASVAKPYDVAPPGAGILASDNVELLGTIPDVGATGGRFVANYFFTTMSGAYPFVPGPNSGLRIYDVTNPAVPVLAGTLPLPHAENEDVDVSYSRRLVLISQDNVFSGLGGRLFVVDWSNVHVPLLKGVLDYPSSVQTPDGKTVGGPGHIANCVSDCARYAYVTGARNGSLFVIDLLDAANPTIAGVIPASQDSAGRPNAVFKTGIVHDVAQDPDGIHVWTTGSGGTTMLDATDALHPVAEKWVSAADDARYDQFIHHNSLRLDPNTVLVTEEDWQQPNCGDGQGREQGSFQAWRIGTGSGEGALTPLGTWVTEVGQITDGTAAYIDTCSSHWFTFNQNKIVAVGWYNQGLRFLDVSNPRNIRQVGYFLGPESMASAGLFAPTDPTGSIVYVPDYQRGLDIVRITNGGAGARSVRAPIRSEWLQPRVTFSRFAPSPVFGFACAVPRY